MILLRNCFTLTALGEKISGTIDFSSQKYKNSVLMGDFNMQATDNNFQTFCESHDLYNFIKDKTCFKTIEGTCPRGGGGGHTSISLTGMLVLEQIATTQKSRMTLNSNQQNIECLKIQTQKNRMPQNSNKKIE